MMPFSEKANARGGVAVTGGSGGEVGKATQRASSSGGGDSSRVGSPQSPGKRRTTVLCLLNQYPQQDLGQGRPYSQMIHKPLGGPRIHQPQPFLEERREPRVSFSFICFLLHPPSPITKHFNKWYEGSASQNQYE